MRNGTLLDYTEQRFIDRNGVYGWCIFNFSEPKPPLDADTSYYLWIWGEGDPNTYVHIVTSGYIGINYDSETYDGSPPHNWANTSYDPDGTVSVYCTYTEGGGGGQG